MNGGPQAELVSLLNRCLGEFPIVLAKDALGKETFSPLHSVTEDSYKAKDGFGGDVGIRALTPEYKEAGYGEEDVMEDGVDAVVLWPIA